jgi:hypothetical protein
MNKEVTDGDKSMEIKKFGNGRASQLVESEWNKFNAKVL